MRIVARLRLYADTLGRLPHFWAAALMAAVILAAVASVTRGAVAVPVTSLFAAARDVAHPLHVVVWEVRTARVVTAALVGAALAVSGALLQTVVRNPLADPALLGVTGGAGVAALLTIIFAPEMTLLLPLCAFGGALAAVCLILLLAFTAHRPGPLKIILSGVAIQSLLFSAIAMISFLFADRAPAFVGFTVGTLNGAGWREARLVAIPAIIGILLAIRIARPLDILLLDDTSALGVGLDVRRARVIAALVSALLAAGAVCVAGMLGFIGLVVPNIVRIVSGPSHRSLITLSALGGGLALIAADAFARLATAPLDLPAGAVVAFAGAPYLLFILWRKLT